MAGGWPIGSEICNATDQGTVTSGASRGTTVTCGAANTEGAWVQLVASSAIDACYIAVTCDGEPNYGAYYHDIAVDIGVGSSGSEQVIVNNLTCSPAYYLEMFSTRWAFPCQIAAGTRIAARAACATASLTANVQVTLFDGEWNAMEGAGGVDTYGFDTGTTQGTAIDPGGTANTKGSYVQITASTTNDLRGFMLGYDDQANINLSVTTVIQVLIDVAIGASGSEVVILPNLPFAMLRNDSNVDIQLCPLNTQFIPIPIPAGTRIAIRAQANNNTATARVFGVTFYGVRA